MKRANYNMESWSETIRLLHPTGELEKDEKVDIFTDTHPPLNERVETIKNKRDEVNNDFKDKYEVEPSTAQKAWRYIRSLFSKNNK